MAIEFPCANCGQQVRTPDAAAGKKGKCPSCGLVQRIPGGEPKPATAPSSPSPPQPRPDAQPKPPATSAQPSSPSAAKPKSVAPAAAPKASPPPAKPATSQLVKPDSPPSLTPASKPPPQVKAEEPKLPTQQALPSKAASQWTSYVKRGADAIRPTPMPPADPRIAPRPTAPKQVLPRREPAAPTPPQGSTPAAEPISPLASETQPTEAEERRKLLDKLTSPASSTIKPERAAAPATRAEPPPTEKFDFPCPHCGKTNRASAERAGKKGRCPHCQAVMAIPSFPRLPGPATPTPSATATARVAPTARQKAPTNPALQGLTVKTNPIRPGKKWTTAPAPAEEIPSLTPISPLTPITAADENLPELTPLTPEQIARLVALEAASSEPELTPLGPVGSSASLSPQFQQPASYLAPAPLKPARPGYGQANWSVAPSHLRRGLPWEQDASLGPLLQTAASVVFTPAAAFREMWQSGGLGHAIGYAALVSIGVAVVTAVFTVLFVAAAGGLVAMNIRPQGSARPFENPGMRRDVAPAVVAQLTLQVGTNLGVAAFQLTVSALVMSGLTHGLLALFGAARGGFGVTFRVFLYCMASAAFFQLVPCCGFWVGLVWTLPILMIGMSYAHDASGPAAAGAVFLGVGVYYSLLFAVLTILSIGIFYAAAGSGLSG